MTVNLTPDLWAAAEAAQRASDGHARTAARLLLVGANRAALSEAWLFRADDLEANGLAVDALAQNRARRAELRIGGAS